ncbi:MAG: EF-hand domain-containing protein [Planctomycetia bacterium]|nr:EF-hand domain-containing protein [Planctomycetia bacterium]
MLPLLLCLLFSADELAFDPNAKPVPEVVDLCDADGDGMITDSEFAAAVKRLVAIGKSKKKSDAVVAKRLDLDGDEKLSEGEALLLCATARYHGNQTVANYFALLTRFDDDKNGTLTKKEFVEVPAASAMSLRKMDANGDGALAWSEVVANVDRTDPTGEGRRVQSAAYKNPQLWQRAVLTVHRLDKDKNARIHKFEADKQVRDKFDDIDADKNGEIKAIELFNWMLAN